MIAIKDFDMPKDCDSCPFYTYYNDAEDDCRITGEGLYHVKIGERHEKCPLVEIKDNFDKTGHWINLNKNNDGHCDDYGDPYVKCSECDICNGTDQSDYCPNCGCHMVEEPQESEE